MSSLNPPCIVKLEFNSTEELNFNSRGVIFNSNLDSHSVTPI